MRREDRLMPFACAAMPSPHPGGKIQHVNGRFRNDKRFGVVQQRAKYDPRCRVIMISNGPDSYFVSPSYDSLRKNGDCTIVVDLTVRMSIGD